jgi:hypothetical protein
MLAIFNKKAQFRSSSLFPEGILGREKGHSVAFSSAAFIARGEKSSHPTILSSVTAVDLRKDSLGIEEVTVGV